MLALRKTRPAFGAALEQVRLPDAELSPGEVLIEVAAAGLCGSDLHAYDWTPDYAFMADNLPVTLGHEFAGIVRAVAGDVETLPVGTRVTCWPTVTCGRCAGCCAGRPEACEARRIIGLHRDGAFAARVRVPAANCRPLPDGLRLETAALTEPLSVAVNAVDLAEVEAGAAVVVLGPGPIGMAAAWVARHRGAEVLLVGLDDTARLARARKLGIDRTADLAGETLEAAVARCFGRRADRVIEATGAARSVEEGLAALRPCGLLVAAGIHAGACRIDLTGLVREKKQLRGAHDTTARAVEEAIRLLAAHGGELSALITHREPLARAQQAMKLARDKQAVKVLLLPGKTAPAAGDD